jgi:ABC-type Mn2+/Zn2+ transport system ATPase subunit
VDAATESAIVMLLHELRNQGKTLLVVHHDLATAKDYFDWMLLLNMRVVAFGETEKVFTQENFLMRKFFSHESRVFTYVRFVLCSALRS